MNRQEFDEYLTGREWRARADAAVAAAGNKCVLCNAPGPGLHAHHRTYENAGNETPADLTCLCRPCHFHTHRQRHAPRFPKEPKPAKPPKFRYAVWKEQQRAGLLP